MALPSYKNINIVSEKKAQIYAVLKKIDWTEAPIVLNILHMGNEQLSILETIDEYFEEYPKNLLPYPVYALADCKYYTGPIYTAKEVRELPKFYNQKSRPLNAKENTIMSKVTLKKANLSNLRSAEYWPILKHYSDVHRNISSLQKEKSYYEEIKKALKENHV